jgi:metallophosphoesterase (TIGR00282 family)
MKILFVGDIMGAAGREAFLEIAIPMKRERKIDALVVNGENAAAGKGISPKFCKEFLDAGADVITLGDHSYDQKELMPYLNEETRVIRPANFAPGCPGRGWTTVQTGAGPLTVISLIGRVFMNPYDCPFRCADSLLAKAPRNQPIFVDMHCEATSEKMAMGWHLAGRVTAVAGTHTHVQTSDDRILKGHTAYITDTGMTGAKDSVIGSEIPDVLKRFLTGLPVRFEPGKDNVSLDGFFVECESNGRATSCERLRIPRHA